MSREIQATQTSDSDSKQHYELLEVYKNHEKYYLCVGLDPVMMLTMSENCHSLTRPGESFTHVARMNINTLEEHWGVELERIDELVKKFISIPPPTSRIATPRLTLAERSLVGKTLRGCRLGAH